MLVSSVEDLYKTHKFMKDKIFSITTEIRKLTEESIYREHVCRGFYSEFKNNFHKTRAFLHYTMQHQIDPLMYIISLQNINVDLASMTAKDFFKIFPKVVD